MKYIVSVADHGYLTGAALHKTGVELLFSKKLDNARHFDEKHIDDVLSDVEGLGYVGAVKKEVGLWLTTPPALTRATRPTHGVAAARSALATTTYATTTASMVTLSPKLLVSVAVQKTAPPEIPAVTARAVLAVRQAGSFLRGDY